MKHRSIFIVIPNIYPCVTGGIELFHYYFIQHINRYYKTFVCTRCRQLPVQDNMQVLFHPVTLCGRQTFSKIFYQLKHLFKHRKIIDLIHLPYSSNGWFQDYHIVLAMKCLGIPYILRIHGGGMHPAKPYFLHQWLFNNAAGIIAVSTPIKKEYEKRHGRPITMIPSMLPFKRENRSIKELKKIYNLSPENIVVLFLGGVKAIKGPDTLLQAFSGLGKEYIEKFKVKLIFAGDGLMKKSLESQTVQSGLAPYVTFLGWVPHEQVSALYKMADIFVIPSLMEARPLALSEAFFNGTPCIGSNISTIANIIQNKKNGLLFSKGSVTDLNKKLQHMIESPEYRRSLGQTARNDYKNMYSYENMIRDYYTFYEKIQ